MKNKIYNYDFLIVGAGLIGSLLALSLKKKKFKFKIIEKHHKILKDQRTLAINANSRDFLSQNGIWDKIKNQPEVINKIIIKDHSDVKQQLVFENKEEPMGHVAYNQEILEIVQGELNKDNSIISGIDLNPDHIKPNEIISLNNSKYTFKKIIFATGKNSNLQKSLTKKFPTDHNSYVDFFHILKTTKILHMKFLLKKDP